MKDWGDKGTGDVHKAINGFFFVKCVPTAAPSLADIIAKRVFSLYVGLDKVGDSRNHLFLNPIEAMRTERVTGIG